MNRFVRRFLAGSSAAAGVMLAVAAVFVGGYFYVVPSLPDAEELRHVSFQTPLQIYSRDGRFIEQFGPAKRTPVAYEQVPEVLIQALIAAEDDRFFEHPGIDYTGILRAAYGVISGRDLGGGSTITQQLARDYFLSRGGLGLELFVRKFKEQIIALRIERELTKQEILELFCNTTFFGQQAFGVAAAARTFFGKELGELTLSEAAIIAGIPRGPSILNPISNVDNARQRREYVLRRMAAVGYITEAERQAALAEPVVSRYHGLESELEAPYVAEMVRLEMIRRFGQEAAYSAGLKVTTTIDSRLQRATNRAVRTTLIEYDERHGYRGPVARVELDPPPAGDAGEGAAPGADAGGSGAEPALAAAAPAVSEQREAEWRRLLAEYPRHGYELGLVLETSAAEAIVFLHSGEVETIGLEGVEWAAPYLTVNAVGRRPDAVSDVLSRGDVVRFRRLADGALRLGQLPEVQGAFVALDPYDGAITALTGGFDYVLSNFNSATQSLRQPGSSFKPFLYSAALEHGYTAARLINDSPVIIPGGEIVYRPENYSGRSHGFTRMREALVHSYNTSAVRTLQDIGLSAAIAHIARFGFEGPALPREAGLALGSGGVAPVDLAAAYAVFANGGFAVGHYFVERIEDADGNELYRALPRVVCTAHPYEEAELPEGLGALGTESTMPCEDREDGESPFSGDGGLVDDATELYPDMRRATRVITPQNAYLMADMMRDVVRRGSGARAYRELERNDLAGKTGTTNDRRDAWFAGFNREIVAAGWVGFPDNRPLGDREEGGITAIPMWIDFMREALAGRPERWIEQPPGIVDVRIDRRTGLAVGGARPDTMFEKFRIGHVPERERERESDSRLPSSPGGGSDDRIFRR